MPIGPIMRQMRVSRGETSLAQVGPTSQVGSTYTGLPLDKRQEDVELR